MQAENRTLPRKLVVGLAAFFALAALTGIGLGQTNDVWSGGSGNWSDGTKWSTGVATATSDVIIDNGAVTMDVNGQVYNLATNCLG